MTKVKNMEILVFFLFFFIFLDEGGPELMVSQVTVSILSSSQVYCDWGLGFGYF